MSGGSFSELAATVHQLRGARRAVRVGIGSVFLLSLAIRGVLAAAATPVLVSDARDYRVLARNLAAGRGYRQVYEGETEVFDGFTFRAFRPPGYPLFLAALGSVTGWNPHAYLLANIVADLVTQVCSLLIATRLLGIGPALFVQILLAMHVLWAPNPMTESLHTALFSLLALLLVFGAPLKAWGGALGFGLAAAAALFLRPVTICVFPALVWRFGWQGPTKRGAWLLVLAVLPSAAGVSAWALRNHRLFGEPVVFTTNLGYHNAWDFGFHADREFARLRAAGLNEAQINRALVQMEWEMARRHPLAWLVTCTERARDLFLLRPAWEVRNVLWERIFQTGPEGSLVGRLYRASYTQYYVTYVLAACGAAVLALRRRGLAGLWSLMLFYVLVHALVSRGDIRLVAPLYPLMCVLAGAFCVVVQQRFGRCRTQQSGEKSRRCSMGGYCPSGSTTIQSTPK